MTDDSDITRQIPLVGDFGLAHDRRCPEPAILAAYADAGLGSDKLTEVENHLADCTSCLNQIGFLVREEGQETPLVPRHLLDTVRESRSHGPTWIPRPALTALAAAAVLMAAILMVPRLETIFKPADVTRPTRETSVDGPHERSLRGGPSAATKPRIVHPTEGAILKGPEIELRWEPFQDALAYSVVVVNLQGDVVWEAHTTTAHANLSNHALAPGARHFVWVEAQLGGGGAIKSAPVGFQLAPD